MFINSSLFPRGMFQECVNCIYDKKIITMRSCLNLAPETPISSPYQSSPVSSPGLYPGHNHNASLV